MKIISAQNLQGKSALLRLDLDVPLDQGRVVDGFRLKAGMDTLKLCLENCSQTTICGHIGRPGGIPDPKLSVAPITNWIREYAFKHYFPQSRLAVLENLRFESGEEACDLEYAKQLASFGEIFINESFAAHHPSASTTLIPTLIPSFAGLKFAKEIETLIQLRDNPKQPLIAIIGGVKVEDKYPAIVALSNIAKRVLVGGLLAAKIKEQGLSIGENVILASLTDDKLDINEASVERFALEIKLAKEIIWAGPLGKYEDPQGNKATLKLAKAVIESKAHSIIGGGDTIAALDFYLDKFSFVSTGGGAMLRLLVKGTLPTVSALG